MVRVLRQNGQVTTAVFPSFTRTFITSMVYLSLQVLTERPAAFLLHCFPGLQLRIYHVTVAETEQVGEFAGKVVFVFFQVPVDIDNTPDCLQNGLLLVFAECIVNMAGKLEKVNRPAPFVVGQF